MQRQDPSPCQPAGEPRLDRAVFSVNEFCEAHRICRATFYALLKSGDGPSVMKIGRRTLITVEAARDWRKQMTVA